MKQKVKCMILYLLITLLCLSGCKQQAPAESNLSVQEQEATTLRWAVMGREQDRLVASRRAGKVNQLLQEKGYPVQIELIYIGNSKLGNQLQILEEQQEKFDIVTFQMMSCGGAQEMAEYLLPLETYMTEGQPLHEVYQLFSEELWKTDQIEGHNYNMGKLLHIVSPTYSIVASEQTEAPEYPEEIFLAGDDEAIWQLMQESEIWGMLPEMYIGDWSDGLYMSHAFHMIAPGVGLEMEDGESFENVWESEYARQKEIAELAHLDEENYGSMMGSNVLGIKKTIRYSVSDRMTFTYTESDVGEKEERLLYWFICPAADKMRLLPTPEQQYTSILKDSEHIEDCLTLLADLNTDQELCEAFCEKSQETPYEQLPVFTALCNAPGEKGEGRTAQQQNECLASLSQKQRSPILGFTFDRRPVEEQVKKLEELEKTRHMDLVKESTQKLNAVIDDEEQLRAVTKEIWQTELANYRQKLKEAGIDEVIAEANRQLEAWNASQKE